MCTCFPRLPTLGLKASPSLPPSVYSPPPGPPTDSFHGQSVSPPVTRAFYFPLIAFQRDATSLVFANDLAGKDRCASGSGGSRVRARENPIAGMGAGGDAAARVRRSTILRIVLLARGRGALHKAGHKRHSFPVGAHTHTHAHAGRAFSAFVRSFA